jgi:hypothetical protein
MSAVRQRLPLFRGQGRQLCFELVGIFRIADIARFNLAFGHDRGGRRQVSVGRTLSAFRDVHASSDKAF